VIIDTVPIGSNYKKVTLRHPAFKDLGIIGPGQCIRLNGRWLAVADHRGDEVDMMVRTSSFLDQEALSEIDSPPGTGFLDLDASAAYFIAAGTGLGAFVSFAARRVVAGLDTTLHFYGRDVTEREVVAAFPVLSKVEMGCWDTARWSRPRLKQEVLVLPERYKVFFAGPMSFQRDLQSVPGGPVINLNYGART
jgi:hypothetical protein